MEQLMKKDESASGANMLLYVIGGVLLLLTIGGVLISLPDIKRYIHISSM
jgi:hypothetical protein